MGDSATGEAPSNGGEPDKEIDWDKLLGDDSSPAAPTGDDGGEAKPTDAPSTGEPTGEPKEEAKVEPAIDKLLNDIEDAGGSSEIDKLVDELRSKLVASESNNAMLEEKVKHLTERALGQVSATSDYDIYKPIIEKVEVNPQLRSLIRLFGSDKETDQNKLIGIVSDMLFDLTGEDLGHLAKRNDVDKAKAALSGGSSSAAPKNTEVNDEENASALF